MLVGTLNLPEIYSFASLGYHSKVVRKGGGWEGTTSRGVYFYIGNEQSRDIIVHDRCAHIYTALSKSGGSSHVHTVHSPRPAHVV